MPKSKAKRVKEENENFAKVIDALDEQRLKHFTILNYIINKNSHPMPRGFNHDKFLDDIQDFENYLLD